MTLNRLLYTSRCAIEGTPAEQARQVRTIAANAAMQNRGKGLSGVLLFADGGFIQILEGPAAMIECTFEDICCDVRHRDVRLIDLVPVTERMFSSWEMALLAQDDHLPANAWRDLSEICIIVGINAREAERQMRRLLDSEPGHRPLQGWHDNQDPGVDRCAEQSGALPAHAGPALRQRRGAVAD